MLQLFLVDFIAILQYFLQLQLLFYHYSLFLKLQFLLSITVLHIFFNYSYFLPLELPLTIASVTFYSYSF
jgi:hypothetical protein